MDQPKLPPIEDMSLEQLRRNITEMSDDELLTYISGTRNNRLTAPAKKSKAKGKKKGTDPELLAAQQELAAMLEEAGLTLDDLLAGDDDDDD